jgi:hypothetical protein
MGQIIGCPSDLSRQISARTPLPSGDGKCPHQTIQIKKYKKDKRRILFVKSNTTKHFEYFVIKDL